MRKTVWVLLCMVWLMLCAALPAFGAESAPHVTAETTMAQLRANPAIQGTGYYTYCREMTPLMVERWKNKTLHDYFGDTDRESGIAALNLIIDNYNKGVKVTYQVYTPEEIEHNSSLGCVQLFYYPAETPNAKTAIVVPGNALTATSEMGEGGSTAYELHNRGYAVFVLRYRTFLDLGNNAPLEDLARAVQLVTSLDEELSIHTQGYALVGYSSGGQLVGVFANKERGYGHYGAAKPGAVGLSGSELFRGKDRVSGAYGYRQLWVALLLLQCGRSCHGRLSAGIFLVREGRQGAALDDQSAAGPGAASGAGSPQGTLCYEGV